jgi:hypothetical protein
LVWEERLKVVLFVAVLVVPQDALGDCRVAALRVPDIHQVIVKDVISGGFGLEGFENLVGFLQKTLLQNIVEEEGLGKLDSILD